MPTVGRSCAAHSTRVPASAIAASAPCRAMVIAMGSCWMKSVKRMNKSPSLTSNAWEKKGENKNALCFQSSEIVVKKWDINKGWVQKERVEKGNGEGKENTRHRTRPAAARHKSTPLRTNHPLFTAQNWNRTAKYPQCTLCFCGVSNTPCRHQHTRAA